jgi:hypothetical protein
MTSQNIIEFLNRSGTSRSVRTNFNLEQTCYILLAILTDRSLDLRECIDSRSKIIYITNNPSNLTDDPAMVHSRVANSVTFKFPTLNLLSYYEIKQHEDAWGR